MAWEEKLPQWEAAGTEPPEGKKQGGFQPGEKPPAPYFNWLFNRVYKVLQEIRNMLDAAASAVTAGTLVKRDPSGRAQVAAPAVPADIARLDTVTGAIADLKTEADPFTQYVEKAGDKMTGPLDVGTSSGFAIGNKADRRRISHDGTSFIFLNDANGYAPVKGSNLPELSVLPENTNLNSVVGYGVYHIAGTYINVPASEWSAGGTGIFFGVLSVNITNSFIEQRLSNVTRSGHVYWRIRSDSGIWGEWVIDRTTRDLTYFVRPDGNDSNSGLSNSSAQAFKTIVKAISIIPPIVNHNIYIVVAPGTYNEDVLIAGHTGGGMITLRGESDVNVDAPNYVINSLRIYGCTCFVNVRVFTCTSATLAAVTVATCARVYLGGIVSTVSTPALSGIVSYNSSCVNLHSCSMNNRLNGFESQQSDMFIDTCSGSGFSGSSAFAGRNSFVSIYNSPTLLSQTAVFAGGIINTLAAGTINPWGDNTTGARTYVHAYGGNNQVLQNLSDTKLLSVFGVAGTDHLGEYTPALSRFAPKTAGIYLVIVNLYASLPSGTEFGAGVLVNNVQEISLGNMKTGASGSALLNGSAMVKMAAGDFLEIHAIQQNSAALSQTIIGDMRYTYLRIVRVA
jgi:hypothetical protein